MNLDVEDSKKEEIGNAITSADSPVGIDAKKTHIIIINKLLEIEKRLDKLEKKQLKIHKPSLLKVMTGYGVSIV